MAGKRRGKGRQTGYKVTIKAREAEAQTYVSLIQEAFDYEAPIFVEATVEGQPNPDKDMWLVRAEVLPETFIMFKIAPKTDRGQPVLAAIVSKGKGITAGLPNQTRLREALGDLDEAKVWISRAWMELNPDDPEVQQIRSNEGIRRDFSDE
tara:strand:+ start:2672 stop:3124 length:453 start_codon:yes stop_codon:yes gene_type:complete